MAKTVKIKGTILKITDTSGKDKLLRILTPAGLLSAFMTFKKSAGKKSFTTDVFTYGEFVLFETDNGNYLVNTFVPEEYFYHLRTDIVALAAAAYFSSLVINSAQEPDLNYENLSALFIFGLNKLASGIDVRCVKPVFEFKLTQLLGFEPCLEAETKSHNYYFDLNDGRLYLSDVRSGFFVSRNTVLQVYNVLHTNPAAAYDIIKEENSELYSLAESYMLFHIERSFDSLEFLKGVL